MPFSVKSETTNDVQCQRPPPIFPSNKQSEPNPAEPVGDDASDGLSYVESDSEMMANLNEGDIHSVFTFIH